MKNPFVLAIRYDLANKTGVFRYPRDDQALRPIEIGSPVFFYRPGALGSTDDEPGHGKMTKVIDIVQLNSGDYIVQTNYSRLKTT